MDGTPRTVYQGRPGVRESTRLDPTGCLRLAVRRRPKRHTVEVQCRWDRGQRIRGEGFHEAAKGQQSAVVRVV
jgi:hypothetical protein